MLGRFVRRILRASFAFAPLALGCGGPSSAPVTAPARPPAVLAGPVAPPAPSLDDDVKALQAAGAASNGALAIVTSLTSEVGARIAGGPKDAAARAWAQQTMQRLGLARVRAEAAQVPHWVRGEESVELVTPGAPARKLHALGLGGTVGTGGKPLEAEVVEVASLAALDALDGAALRGKIVFVNPPPMVRAPTGAGYGEGVGVRWDAPRKAWDKGALAAVIRSVGTDTAMPHTGMTSRKGKVPGVALSNDDADALHEALGRSKRARLRVSLGAEWKELAPSANVVGEIVGRERPDEIVLMGAHLDSWDVGQGAEDDGAGCAIVLEAARLVAARGRTPRRTVRVVLFASEELGVAGGDAYTAAHEAEASAHVLLMEADSGSGKARLARLRGGAGARPAWARLGAMLGPLGIPTTDEEAHGGADVDGMMKKGAPTIDIAQDSSRYFDVHHTDADTIDHVDPDGLRQLATAFATLAWAVADGDLDLGRAEVRQEKTP